ncbi:GTP cyclohydrolase II [Geranomyces michiganensis]|nr:GTP cyclohydrolase II [Geranomyces michiganensis]
MLRGVKNAHIAKDDDDGDDDSTSSQSDGGDGGGGEHLPDLDGSATAAGAPLVRIHSCCFTGETLRSLRCDCAEQLEEAMRCMAKANRGVVLYLKQEGRGIGLRDKLRAYNLIDLGHDTMAANLLLGHPPDARSYEIASAMLRDLGVGRVRLLTNNPDKLRHLERDGVVVTERVPMVPASWRRLGLALATTATTTTTTTTTTANGGAPVLAGGEAETKEKEEEECDADNDAQHCQHATHSSAAATRSILPNGHQKASSRLPPSPKNTPPPPQPQHSSSLISATTHQRAATTRNGSSLSPLSSSSSSSTTTTITTTSVPTTLTTSSSVAGLRLQDRDEYLVTKVQRMGHILDIPIQVLEAVNNHGFVE